MLSNPYIDPRCTDTTAHGNRCRMLRANDKTSLCQMHFDQQRRMEEDDLAGGQILSPIEDLKTPAQINDALRRLFQIVARQRIPPRHAAILAYICQLCLSSLAMMERQSLRAETAPAVPASPPSGEQNRSAHEPSTKSHSEDPQGFDPAHITVVEY